MKERDWGHTFTHMRVCERQGHVSLNLRWDYVEKTWEVGPCKRGKMKEKGNQRDTLHDERTLSSKRKMRKRENKLMKKI